MVNIPLRYLVDSYHPDSEFQLALLLQEDGVRAVLGGRPEQLRLRGRAQELGQHGLVRVTPGQDDLGALQLRGGVQLPLAVQLPHPADMLIPVSLAHMRILATPSHRLQCVS